MKTLIICYYDVQPFAVSEILVELKGCLQQHLGVHIWSENFRVRNVILQLILDCTKLVPKILPDKRDFLLRIETHAILLCYKLHLKKLYLYGCQRLLLPIYITEQNLKGIISGRPIRWIPSAPIYRRNIRQQEEEWDSPGFCQGVLDSILGVWDSQSCVRENPE